MSPKLLLLTDRSVKNNMSPRTEAKNREIRQESMQKIMDAAFGLIAGKGYESTSIAEIAAAAGVSKGLLYNYFKGKQDLVEKLLINAVSQADSVMDKKISEDPAVTLENIFRWLFSELKERPDYFRLLTELTLKIDKFAFVHDMAAQKYTGYMVFLEDILRRLNIPDPAGEAKMLAALFDGIGLQYLVIREAYPMDELEKFLIDKYCKKKRSI
jgi:AcrR family transcriptional regulator